MARVAGVLFDIGGVVQDSPLHAIARYERDHGLPANAINRAVVASGEGGAWSRLERGELTLEAWCSPFEADCRAHGVAVDGKRLMTYITGAGRERPQMLRAIRRLRERGLRVGALTNNWPRDENEPGQHRLRPHFDVVIESQAVGMRKPDPRIYLLTCERLGVAPEASVFIDDNAENVQSARALGMETVRFGEDPFAAMAELDAILTRRGTAPPR